MAARTHFRCPVCKQRIPYSVTVDPTAPRSTQTAARMLRNLGAVSHVREEHGQNAVLALMGLPPEPTVIEQGAAVAAHLSRSTLNPPRMRVFDCACGLREHQRTLN